MSKRYRLSGKPIIMGMVVPLGFEFFLKLLYGSQYHGYVGEKSLPTWRKDMAKLIHTIRRTIRLNVISDRHHLITIDETCERAEAHIRSAKSIDDVSQETIQTLARLCFLLVGQMPNHYDSKSPYRDDNWILNQERRVQFVQTNAQKVNLILALAEQGFFEGPMQAAKFRVKIHELGGCAEFLEWFRIEYAIEYSSLF